MTWNDLITMGGETPAVSCNLLRLKGNIDSVGKSLSVKDKCW